MNNKEEAGVIIFQKKDGSYIVLLNPPRGEQVEVYLAGKFSNRFYKMTPTDECASIETFTGEAEQNDITVRTPFELVVDND
jgi:hypothetical protein